MKFIPSQINFKPNKTVWVVDDFYKDPYAVREFALKQLRYFRDDFKNKIISFILKELKIKHHKDQSSNSYNSDNSMYNS